MIVKRVEKINDGYKFWFDYSILIIAHILLLPFWIILWIIIPVLSLTIFLIVASYHFGKEDADFVNKAKNKFDNLFFFFKGSLVIVSPLLFHKSETLLIFQSLTIKKKPTKMQV